MPVVLDKYRRAASILFGKLEMDVTMDELRTTKKAHDLMSQGKNMASIRATLKLPTPPVTDFTRRKLEVDSRKSHSHNLGAHDLSVRRQNGSYTASHLNKAKA